MVELLNYQASARQLALHAECEHGERLLFKATSGLANEPTMLLVSSHREKEREICISGEVIEDEDFRDVRNPSNSNNRCKIITVIIAVINYYSCSEFYTE